MIIRVRFGMGGEERGERGQAGEGKWTEWRKGRIGRHPHPQHSRDPTGVCSNFHKLLKLV